MDYQKRLITIVAAILVLSVGRVYCQEMPIPGELQAPIFQKIFSYDRSLKGSSEIVIYLVGSESEESSMTDLADAFQGVGVTSEITTTGILEGSISSGSVVYVMPGADKDQITLYCAANKLLSISGVPPLAEQGHVSVSIGKKGDRPQIIVNLPRLKAEGHDLSADVLKLAKIIR